MIRGTNLLLDGRVGAALATLETATGESSEGTMATAHDSCPPPDGRPPTPRGDRRRLPVGLARHPGWAPARLQLSQSCWPACWPPPDRTRRRARCSSRSATAVRSSPARQPPSAPSPRRCCSSATPRRPGPCSRRRTFRPSGPVVPLAAGPPGRPRPGHGSPGRPGRATRLERAVEAGEAGRRVLGGGAPAEARHRPYLPARWCLTTPASTTVALFGVGTVRRDHRIVDHPAWHRTRVRELCLLLALLDQVPRAQVR